MPAHESLRLLLERAGAADGVISRTEALALGVPSSTLRDLVASGVYQVVHPGVYCVTGTTLSLRGRARAGLLYVGGNAAISRSTAALLRGWPVKAHDGRIHLTTDVRSGPFPTAIVLHRTRRFLPESIATHEGLRVTSPERTLCDLAGERPRMRELPKVTAHALRTGDVTVDSLRTSLEGLAGIPGARRLLALTLSMSPLEASTRSELESRFLRLMTAAGRPPTQMNHPVTDGDGRLRYLDAVYLPERLPIELDSEQWHRLPSDQRADRARANALTLAGWRAPLRFTWWDITERADHVRDTVLRALAAV